jgi:hypothetical protein
MKINLKKINTSNGTMILLASFSENEIKSAIFEAEKIINYDLTCHISNEKKAKIFNFENEYYKKMEELEVFEEWFYETLEIFANQKKAQIKNWLNCALTQKDARKSIEISNNGDCESWEFEIETI